MQDDTDQAQAKVWLCGDVVTILFCTHAICILYFVSELQLNALFQQRGSKRCVFVVQTTQPISKSMILSKTEADLIYCKQIDKETIYVIKYNGKNEKQHTTVDNLIEGLDKSLRAINKTETTFFKSINDENSRSSKVLSFERGARKENHLYRTLFDQKDRVLPDVIVWTKSGTYNPKPEADIAMFDVVKKRKAIDEAPIDEENNPQALAQFEEFERSVLPVLERIHADENDFRRLELMQIEESLARGVFPTMTGGVYFAWSACLGCMKIGCTRRENPLVRLREISQYVTSPFILSAWLPSLTPFMLEAVTHKHFNDKRINTRGSGAGTEFFNVSEAEAVAYCVGNGAA